MNDVYADELIQDRMEGRRGAMMKWNRSIKKEDGYYWYRLIGKHHASIAYLYKTETGLRVRTDDGSVCRMRDMRDYEWSGPIPLPEES